MDDLIRSFIEKSAEYEAPPIPTITNTGLASRLIITTLALLSKYLPNTGPNSTAKKEDIAQTAPPALLANEFWRFRLWAGGFNIPGGHFDDILEQSRYLKEPTITLMASFALLLAQEARKGREVLQKEDSDVLRLVGIAFQEAANMYPEIAEAYYDSESEDQDSVVEEVHDIVDLLFELAPKLDELLENALPYIDPGPSPTSSEIFKFYRGLILDKFSKANPQLISRFAGGNEKCHQIARGEIAPEAETSGIDVSLHYAKSYGQSLGLSFHDSGVGSSLRLPLPIQPTPSESDVSAYSSATIQENRPSIPSMPERDASTGGFICPLCLRMHRNIVTNRQWKNHVFMDIKPYMCTHETCQQTDQMFGSRQEWINHEKNPHPPLTQPSPKIDAETCPFCKIQFSPKKSQQSIYRHIGGHMEDIRLLTLPPSLRYSGDDEDVNMFDDSSDESSENYDIRSKMSTVSRLSVVSEVSAASGVLMPGYLEKDIQEAYSEEKSEEALGPETLGIRIGLDNTSLEPRDQGEFEEFESDKEPLDEQEKTPESKHSSNITSGKNSNELELIMDTDLRELDNVSEEHSDTLSIMFDRFTTYRELKRFVEAEELGMRVPEIRKRELDEEHPDTLNAMSYLVATYGDLKRLAEAEELGVRLLEIRKRELGEEHPHTLIAMSNLAATYGDLKRLAEAEELGVRVLEISKRVLGEEHPDTLNAMSYLAATYRDLKRLAEAEELGVRLLEISKRVLGEEHPDTLIAMSYLAATYRDLKRLAEAEELGARVLEISKRELGEEHPDTLIAMSNLAATYRDLKRLAEAEELGARVLEISKRVLGEEHPYTLKAMSNLAVIYRDLKRLAEAEELGVRVLEISKRVLGEEHPDTLNAMSNLAVIYRDLKRLRRPKS